LHTREAESYAIKMQLSYQLNATSYNRMIAGSIKDIVEIGQKVTG
jgi:hypothetical protein